MKGTAMRALTRYLLFGLALLCTAVSAEEEITAEDELMYVDVYPPIVVNYKKTKGSRLGYLHIGITFSVKGQDAVDDLEWHMPMIRDALIELTTSRTEENIKSLQERETIRSEMLTALNAMFKEELDEELILEVLFTKYMWQ